MLRDEIATLSQYENRIKRARQSIEIAEKQIVEGVIADDYMDKISHQIWSDTLLQIRAGYSAGYGLDELAAIARGFYQGVPSGSENFTAGLDVSAWTVSFGILFSIDKELLRKTMRYGVVPAPPPKRSRLFYRLLATEVDIPEHIYAIKETSSSPFLADIVDSIETDGKEAASQALNQFVRKKWYPAKRGYSWWGSHKRPFMYVGYWAFDAAAAAVTYGLDDSALEGHKYYPWDLAEYARSLRG